LTARLRPDPRNPKPLIGYSDITALHTAINRHAGLMTFHGAMLNADLLGASLSRP
jgi:muramoyltetrapeptide carboxypeptidase